MMENRWPKAQGSNRLEEWQGNTAHAEIDRTGDLELGPLRVSPSRRQLDAVGHSQKIEPVWMAVLVALAARRGELVTRQELFARCWSAPVGDDSLNRAIAGLRAVGARFGPAGFTIETVRAAGYVLRPGADQHPAPDAVTMAWRSWERDDPVVDHAAISALETAIAAEPGDAEKWGLLALLARMAAENAQPSERAQFVELCQTAAGRALALVPREPVSLTALATLPPIFGDWTPRRAQIARILDEAPDCVPALHEMAILEMSTGRPSAAIPLVEGLLERFPHAPTLLYKRIYHLWVMDRIAELDRVSERAVQLWPAHQAIVVARFTALAFTGRLEQATLHLEESEAAARLTASATRLARLVLSALHARDSKSPEHRVAVAQIAGMAPMGPVQANGALVMLAGLCALDEAFALADGYFLGRGPMMIGVHHAPGEAAITNKFRRGTQPLFIPSSGRLRADPRFAGLMEAIGLADYWRCTGITPDFQES